MIHANAYARNPHEVVMLDSFQFMYWI